MTQRKKKQRKKIWIAIVSVLGALALLAGAYVIYVMASFERIADLQPITVEGTPGEKNYPETGKIYTMLTSNIGFGAYSKEFSFFLDGGQESRAYSKEAVEQNVTGSAKLVEVFAPDFILFQEVDRDSTRSYHTDELEILNSVLDGYQVSFAYNYLDSPFFLWPLFQPHGTINSGIATFSKFTMESAVRRSLPITGGVRKYMDLDRCYSISRIPVENGKTLCLYQVHLSAYAGDEKLVKRQLSMLFQDMQEEYTAGNYVICGGDFNCDLQLSEEEETAEALVGPFPRSSIPEGFRLSVDLIPETRLATLQGSWRDTSKPYRQFFSETCLIDGFLVSDNVTVVDVSVVNGEFQYSDHNPVLMFFQLNP